MFTEFDLLNPSQKTKQFNVVLCEQVLEHVQDKLLAIRTLLIKFPIGALVIITPYLNRRYGILEGYWGFTPSAIEICLRKRVSKPLKCILGVTRVP